MLWVILLIFFTTGQASDLDGADVVLPMVKAEAVLGEKADDAQERVPIAFDPQRNRSSDFPEKKNCA